MKLVASFANLGEMSVRAAAVAGFILSAQFATAQMAEAGDYKFQADYRVSLAGVPIGQAHLEGDFDGPQYRLDGFGKLTGLVGAVYEYTASASSAGQLYSGKAVPNAFSVNATDGSKTATVRMTMNESGIRRLKLTPTPTPYWLNHPSRVQVTDAHTRGTIDPITALIVTDGKTANGLDQRACNRTVPIFNGRERFDVSLEYRRIDKVSDASVPGGQVLVCGAKYHPVAGHRTDRDEVKLAEKLDIELMLAPIDGSDLLLPYRVTIPTPLGSAVVQAAGMSATGALRERAAALVK